MKTKNEKRASLYEQYQRLYRSSLNVHSEYFTRLEGYMKQYLGTYELDNAREPASTVRNITYEIIESQIDPDIPYPKAESEVFSEINVLHLFSSSSDVNSSKSLPPLMIAKESATLTSSSRIWLETITVIPISLLNLCII